MLGDGGVQKIIELKLTDREQADFKKSVSAVKELVAKMGELLQAAS